MTTLTEEQDRIERMCRSLHNHIGTPAGRVFRDCSQPMILTEYRDFEIRTSWDYDEVKDLSDSALDDLICQRKVERLKDAQRMLQKEIEAIKNFCRQPADPVENL